MPPAFGGKHDIHGLEDGAHAPVASLDKFGHVAVAEAEVQVYVAGVPSKLEGTGKLLQIDRREMTPKVAVLECEALPFGRGEKGGLAAEPGGYTVGAGIFGPNAETESGRDIPVEDEGAATNAAGGVVEIVETIAREGEGMHLGRGGLAGGCGGGDEQQQQG